MAVNFLPYILLLGVSWADPDAIGQETYLLQTQLEVTRNSVGKVAAEKDGRVSVQAERSISCKPGQTDVLVSVDAWSMSSSNATLAISREPGGLRKLLHENRIVELETLSTEGVDFILYGSSSMEQWRETFCGIPCSQVNTTWSIHDCEGNKETWHKFFGPSRPAVMAVAGDTTADLLWRLENGEAPLQQPKAIFVQIGVNNMLKQLGVKRFLNSKTEAMYAEEKPRRDEDFERIMNETYFGIEAVVRKLLMSCPAPIIVTALPPTGYLWPAGPSGQMIPHVNARLNELASKNAEFVHVIDCSTAALNTSSGKIDPAMMPDFLHLSPKAMERWAECMYRGLQDI